MILTFLLSNLSIYHDRLCFACLKERALSVVVSDLRSEIKCSWFELGQVTGCVQRLSAVIACKVLCGCKVSVCLSKV